VHRIDDDQRRARLARRHLLAPAPRAVDPVAAARSVLALHATDPVSVHLSALARMDAGEVAAVERALYQDRSLIRMLGMRRTMFVVPVDVAPVVQSAVTRAVAKAQRRLLEKHLAEAGIEQPAAWLADVERSTLAALISRGTASAADLAADEPRLRTTLRVPAGKSYTAPAVTSRVLFLLGADGLIVRGRPSGGWNSTRYTWSPLADWLPDGLPEIDPAAARAQLIRHWLAVFGPAPVSDITWWTGLGVRDVSRALAELDVADVMLESGPGVVLPDDVDPEPASAPWAALLPSLDPTPMGWKDRDWLLGAHVPHLMDRTGNIGPTLWWDGRVVGAWAQRTDGEIAYRVLEDIGAEGLAAVQAEAARVAAHIGEVRFTPRFPVPLEKELRLG
jgi:hypothetical protein